MLLDELVATPREKPYRGHRSSRQEHRDDGFSEAGTSDTSVRRRMRLRTQKTYGSWIPPADLMSVLCSAGLWSAVRRRTRTAGVRHSNAQSAIKRDRNGVRRRTAFLRAYDPVARRFLVSDDPDYEYAD